MAGRFARTFAAMALTAAALATNEASADDCLPAAKISGEPVATVFARGRAAYEARRFEEAARAFREIAFEHSGEGMAIPATQLYLESLNRLGTAERKTACFDAMATDAPSLHALYCDTPAKLATNDEACRVLDAITVDVERLRAQRSFEEADKSASPAEAEVLFRKSGAAYLDLFAAFCEKPVAKGARPRAERCDELVYNGARAFAAVHDTTRSIAAFRTLVAFDEKTKKGSPLVAKAHYAIGASYQAIASYEEAATWYERFATLYPKEPTAKSALSDAAILRLGMRQEEIATRDVERFTKNYGVSWADYAFALVLVVAEHYQERDEWEKARAILQANHPPSQSSPDLAARYHALLARDHAKGSAKSAKLAASEYAKVLALWSEPAAARASQASTDERGRYRLARALLAVGEALFEVAEAKRLEQVEPLRPPAYGGPRDGASVTAHLQTKVREWVEKRRAAIAAVESDYGKVLEVRPYPAPGAVVSAAHRVAMMWADLVDDLRSAPSPSAGRKDPLYKSYQAALDAMVTPILGGSAKPALSKCIDIATKFQYRAERTRECELWMAKNFKGEFHLVDEVVPALVPRARGGPGVNPASPLREDGKPHRS